MDVLLTMRAFRRVVERNSFYKAAEDLAITPAALSKQIKQLENRLGTLLLVRTTRSMSLTEAGLLYYQKPVVCSASSTRWSRRLPPARSRSPARCGSMRRSRSASRCCRRCCRRLCNATRSCRWN